MSDLVSDGTYFEVNVSIGNTSGAPYPQFDLADWEVQATFKSGDEITQTADARVEGGSVGFGLQFFADVDGVPVPTATAADYVGSAGDLIEEGPDQLRHFIAEHCGLGHAAIDDTSFGAALTNLDTNVYAGIANGLGTGFDEIIKTWAWEMRANIVSAETDSGRVYKLLTANQSYSYGSSSKTLGDAIQVRESRVDIRHIGTRFRAFWNWNAFLGSDEQAFTEVTRADSDVDDTGVGTADFTNAETRVGRRDYPPMFFWMIRDEATAQDTLGFYATYMVQDALALFEVEAPTWDSYALEPGDVVELQPSWDVAATKCRVLIVEREPTEPMARLVLSEVE